MDRFLYTGEHTRHISFPLGGIGAGGIGLAGNGHLVDWEIFNKPNKGSVNGFSHFAIRAEEAGATVDARILQGDLTPPFMGDISQGMFQGFGFGPRREYMSGLPHFRDVEFRGEFPLATLRFVDETFPGDVCLRAFSPLIPLEEDDCSLPAAFFEFEISAPEDRRLTYTLVGVLANPQPAVNLNRMDESMADEGLHLLHLSSTEPGPDSPAYGDLTLGADTGHDPGQTVSWQEYWFRGAWFDNLEVYWQDLTRPGPFSNRRYEGEAAGAGNEALLAVHVPVNPGETRRVRFVIAWNFPNCVNDWSEDAVREAAAAGTPNQWRNWYATRWADSRDSASFALREWDRLHDGTGLFHNTLFASDLPLVALEAVSANLSTLKTPVVKRLEDGTLYGWEGAHVDAGCCEGSCTHVWNYQQTVPFLFPRLERSMRAADYKYNLLPNGAMPFRLQLPLGTPRHLTGMQRPCCDGQFGGVMKIYRDWKICGDTDWLRELWPGVRRSIEYAWHPENPDRWDPDRTGVLQGRQHHTLDVELFGPNAWMIGFYLGALKAGAEMAEALGEQQCAREFRTIFERGRAWVDGNLFDGEYYHQRIDLTDRSVLEPFVESVHTSDSASVLESYWTEEYGEIKYQIGEGCEIDQVLAQWHANLYGLGDLLDPEKVQSALTHLFTYNFKRNSREDYNPCRVYTLNDEAGLQIATWPEGRRQPVIPLPYSQETQNGYEYAAALHMIGTGLVAEGVEVVAAIRDRYDGAKRNPWNEIECGSNYARSMAAFALLNTFAGFEFDMRVGMVGFNPVQGFGSGFRCLWALAPAWGQVVMEPGEFRLEVAQGSLPVRIVKLPGLANAVVQEVRLGSELVGWRQSDTNGEVRLSGEIEVTADAPLRCRWMHPA
ncbi:MAG: GH116 family glycosyl-hydrolase [Caldilineaceae bacterium]|nr:GH116 family glycosyl-hydrolase [Caldilineaceae bacterium]